MFMLTKLDIVCSTALLNNYSLDQINYQILYQVLSDIEFEIRGFGVLALFNVIDDGLECLLE